MKLINYLAVIFSVIVLGASFYYLKLHKSSSSQLIIKNARYPEDVSAIDALFHKGDNLYWMIAGNPLYSVDYMVRHASSSQHAPLHDLVMKAAFYQNDLVGFLAYYKQSSTMWRLLFLIVDQDYRRKGFAKDLLDYALRDMVTLGAKKITLFTRNNNFKAQSLYKSFGFKQTLEDDIGVWFTLNT